MITDAICIVLLVVIMAFLFVRRNQKLYAFSALAVAIMPVVHIIIILVGEIFKINLSPNTIMIADIIGLAVSEVLIGLIANFIEAKKTRVAYIIIGSVFNLALVIIFILNDYPMLLK